MISKQSNDLRGSRSGPVYNLDRRRAVAEKMQSSSAVIQTAIDHHDFASRSICFSEVPDISVECDPYLIASSKGVTTEMPSELSWQLHAEEMRPDEASRSKQHTNDLKRLEAKQGENLSVSEGMRGARQCQAMLRVWVWHAHGCGRLVAGEIV